MRMVFQNYSDTLVIVFDEITIARDSVSTNVMKTISTNVANAMQTNVINVTSTVSTNFHNSKIYNGLLYFLFHYIFLTILEVIILVRMIIIICYH